MIQGWQECLIDFEIVFSSLSSDNPPLGLVSSGYPGLKKRIFELTANSLFLIMGKDLARIICYKDIRNVPGMRSPPIRSAGELHFSSCPSYLFGCPLQRLVSKQHPFLPGSAIVSFCIIWFNTLPKFWISPPPFFMAEHDLFLSSG